MKEIGIRILLIFLLSFITSITYAQVTIGSGQAPSAGALLDIKEFSGLPDNTTASKGLLLPRVALTDLGSLKDISGAENEDKVSYTGLLIYNVNEVIDPCGNIPSGIYVWDGERWGSVEGAIVTQTSNKAHLGDLQALQAIKNANTGNTITWTIDLDNRTYTDPDGRLKFGGDCANQRLTSLDCSDNRINNLNVAPFEELLTLNCSDNQLSNLVVRENRKLKNLDCSHNYFTDQNSLDLTLNRDLEHLVCNDNSFHSLNISQNRELTYIDCANNRLDALDVTQHPRLEFLDCSFNNLSSLNILQSSLLHTLYCNDNKLAQLNVTHNPELKNLNASNNQALNQNTGSAEICQRTWDTWDVNANIIPARDHRMYRTVNCN